MSDLKQFERQNYFNMETFRKSGAGVKTPVWFVQDGNLFYVITEGKSGKVKRIRNNGNVRIAPCRGDGHVTGEWVDAQAQIVEESTLAHKINQMLNQKYGLAKHFFSILRRLTGSQSAFLKVEILE
jgi:PPOX class probable F420-dependent enzyme